ncbi:nucleoplasmin-like protein isoform X2 [Rhynchophorus ferrugineus]|uniref:nucleoplasmin-like protein isoform X2 n=1 Tax=Rhynchophorus ferrugineus TaxID=354439 RepID=UPI003FCC6F51
MADEYFFALTLKGKNASEVWDPEAKGAGAEEYQGGHKLIIKHALLGPEVADGEVNVVQVEAMTWKDAVKIPIATLKAGGPNSQVLLDLSFPDPPVTFALLQGNGPVHIIGHHLIGGPLSDYEENMEEMEEEMIEDDDGEEGAFVGKSLLGKQLGNFIARKLEEEEDDEEPKTKKAKTSNNTKGKSPVKNNAKAKK